MRFRRSTRSPAGVVELVKTLVGQLEEATTRAQRAEQLAVNYAAELMELRSRSDETASRAREATALAFTAQREASASEREASALAAALTTDLTELPETTDHD